MPKILVWCFGLCTECVLTFPLKQLRVQNEGFMSNLIKIECFTLTMTTWKFRFTEQNYNGLITYLLTSGASLKAPTHCVTTVQQLHLVSHCEMRMMESWLKHYRLFDECQGQFMLPASPQDQLWSMWHKCCHLLTSTRSTLTPMWTSVCTPKFVTVQTVWMYMPAAHASVTNH